MFENKKVQPVKAAHNALSLGSDFQDSRGVNKKSQGLWVPPPGALFQDLQRVGSSAILRGENGGLYFVASKNERCNSLLEIQ